jgi:hypothetical protein
MDLSQSDNNIVSLCYNFTSPIKLIRIMPAECQINAAFPT